MVRIVKRSAKLDGDLSVNSTLMYHAAPITFDLDYLFSIQFFVPRAAGNTKSAKWIHGWPMLKPFCAATGPGMGQETPLVIHGELGNPLNSCSLERWRSFMVHLWYIFYGKIMTIYDFAFLLVQQRWYAPTPPVNRDHLKYSEWSPPWHTILPWFLTYHQELSGSK